MGNARAYIDNICEAPEYVMGKVPSEVAKRRRKTFVGKVRVSMGRGKGWNSPEKVRRWEASWTVYGKNYSVQNYSANGELPDAIVRKYRMTQPDEGVIGGEPAQVHYPEFSYGGWVRMSTVGKVRELMADRPDILHFWDTHIEPIIWRSMAKFERDLDLPKEFLGAVTKPDVRYDVPGKFRIFLKNYRWVKGPKGVAVDRFAKLKQPDDILAVVQSKTEYPSTFWVLLNPEEKEQLEFDIRQAARAHVSGALGGET